MASAGGRSTDACTVEEQQLFNNLCLLGLAGPGAKPLATGIELTRFTFRKPSTKVLEAVLFHLYVAVWGEAAAQKVCMHTAHLAACSPCIMHASTQAGECLQQGALANAAAVLQPCDSAMTTLVHA